MLTCRTLRGAILTSGFLMLAGWLAELLGSARALPIVVTAYLGLILVLAAAGFLGLTFFLSLLPANARRLAACEH